MYPPARKARERKLILVPDSDVIMAYRVNHDWCHGNYKVWELSAKDIGLIQGLLAEHRDWGRTRLSEELCCLWDWRNAQGRIKDMAARTLLLKLERGGHIRLPERRRASSNGLRNRDASLVDEVKAEVPKPCAWCRS